MMGRPGVGAVLGALLGCAATTPSTSSPPATDSAREADVGVQENRRDVEDRATGDLAAASERTGPEAAPDAVDPDRGGDKGAQDALVPSGALLATYMCKRGRLLFSDDFRGPLSPAWPRGIGDWRIVDGVLRGAQNPADGHRAVIKHDLAYRDAVVQVAFKFEGASLTGVELNEYRGGGAGDVCRIEVTPTQLSARADTGRSRYLSRKNVSLTPGKWYRLLVELRGPELLGQIDDQVVAFGEDAGNDRPKNVLGFGPVEGAEAHFDDFSVWECLPNPDWPSIKQTLP